MISSENARMISTFSASAFLESGVRLAESKGKKTRLKFRFIAATACCTFAGGLSSEVGGGFVRVAVGGGSDFCLAAHAERRTTSTPMVRCMPAVEQRTCHGSAQPRRRRGKHPAMGPTCSLPGEPDPLGLRATWHPACSQHHHERCERTPADAE